MSNEKNINSSHEKVFDSESLMQEAHERNRGLAAERERNAAERSSEDLESARREALERASSSEKESARAEKSLDTSPAQRRGPASKRERDASFNATMTEVRSQMSAPSRMFSNIIHHPAIEKTSDVVGSTIARPNAIASGAVFSFIFTLAIYLVARFNGYPLSGTETIASFLIGWVLGLIFDYLRLLVLGKK
ncbi:hypothetical protein B7Z00_04610 [Candidatus Saccharibacteria bacterium 32-50-10]|nr:MAG: hypothetical protein B7Z00_04610 [Candidatus Saccharibacteria bacterium 32-50-10]